jgi:LmbE family N-acetylglucosaminyl deacetylase
VVVTVDPTPVLRQHPDHRAVARASMDAAWPYAGADGAYPEHGAPAHPKEAWVYAGPAPDMFVRFEGAVQSRLAELNGSHAPTEEKFAQIDLRDRSSEGKEALWPT